MKSVYYKEFGKPEDVLIHGEVNTPEPKEGEVLVHLKTSAVNPSDVKKRAGPNPDLLQNGLIIPHSDGAGVIEAVGPGVPGDRIGERVYVYQGQFRRSMGTAAEYIAIPGRRAVTLPDDVSFEIGASAGIPMFTAHRCVFADGPVKNKILLITGGAGRVGYYAIQWALRGGARVLATASNKEDRQACLDLGVEAVFNHRNKGWGEEISRYLEGKKADRVVDVEFGANLEEVLSCIAVGGYIATYSSTVVPEPSLPFRRMMFMDLTLRMVIVYRMPEDAKDEAIAKTDEVLRNRAFSHRIAEILPLDQCVQAHKLIERGASRGVVLLSI
ncbi:MAG: NADPH:quinone reductase [Spirochaetaceae bacterium]|jgi:NADPH2:quinone reductase|nr:NADPH:quinone reductase [Spirochaetaceae bacterium]